MNIHHQKIVHAQDRGRFYVIGTGPSGPQMATIQALETIKQVNAIIASNDHVELFADYVGNKPILFDPWEGLFYYKGKSLHQLTAQERTEFMKQRRLIIDDRIMQIMNLLAEGKNVGLLDNGNPCLFAPCQWYVEQFDSVDVVIIPGMGSDAAAMAALGKSVIPAYSTRFVIQTSPFYLLDHTIGDDHLLKDLAKYPATIIQYMALQMPEKLFATLSKVYPPDMPCAVVYWAGYSDKQRIVRGTIADMGSKLLKEEEKYMGLLLIGRFLEGKPYGAAMSQSKLNLK
ncbi:MAG: tetrapyrrole methylase [Candidatus Altiarchaeales archaeon WOR_SM1_79]|nr:MAG: tetrapyrrole methylase [Candidatus Altiarchaeales archaeon WOR_SM1_79]